MSKDKKYSDTLRVRIDPELLEKVKREADSVGTDVSTYVRWCVQTGLYLDDLNTFIRLRTKDEKEEGKEGTDN